MSADWKPGDVAIAYDERVFMDLSGEWRWAETRKTCMDQPPYGLRPLAVIDAQDPEQVGRLADAFCHARWDHTGGGDECDPLTHSSMQAALREFANPKPPRIDEPGIWAVVEASCVHSDERRKWTRHEDDNWYPIGAVGREAGLPDDWDSLADPTLIRAGVAE